ncbi:MAG TPA: hypothetical protein VKZ98_11460 [Aquaticitalea sp.]|nr:hypothetical protein [Aquaticitalea sp.]
MEEKNYVTIEKPTAQQIERFELPFRLTEEERKLLDPLEKKLHEYQEKTVPDYIHGMKLSPEDKYLLVVDSFVPSDEQDASSTRKQYPDAGVTYRVDDGGRLILESVKADGTPAIPLNRNEVKFINNQNVMEQNTKFIKDQLTYLGFGDKTISDAFEKAVSQGNERFTLTVRPEGETLSGNKSKYELSFNKSSQSDMYFFNNFKTTLIDKTDNPVRSQSFHVNSTKGVTAKESVNLLEGRAVSTVLQYKDQESKVFAKLNFDETNKHGNYRYKTFNENYGVDLKSILSNAEKNAGLKLQNSDTDRIEKSLSKGNLIQSDFLVNGKETKGYIALDPEFKKLDFFDSDLKKVYFKQLGQGQPVEKEKNEVSISIDNTKNQTAAVEPVVLAKLSEKQSDKLMKAYESGEGKLPSLTPKQMATVPTSVFGNELSNEQRRDLLYGNKVKLDERTSLETIKTLKDGKNELIVSRTKDDVGEEISNVNKVDVKFDAPAKELKPFESAEQTAENSKGLSR